MCLSRLLRQFFCLQAVLWGLIFAKNAFAQSPHLATLDWTVAETLIAFGEPPVAVGDVKSYQRWVAHPELPENTVDLGIRMQPNPEQIRTLTPPILFINSSFYAQAAAQLQKFAQVETVNFYHEGEAWQNIVDGTQRVATLIGKPEAAEKLMAQYWQKIAELKPLAAPHTARPVILVQFIDTRHFRIYAENSPFGAVLKQLGFQNAWQGSHNHWGFENIEITRLAHLPQNSRFVVVKPYPANIASALKHNTLWQKLALAKDPLILPPIWTFGGVPSAQRFAEAFTHALIYGGEQW